MSLKKSLQSGYSLLELLIAMTVLLMLMAVATTLFARALGVRARESRTTDALTSAYAALNLISREMSNSGFGLADPVKGRAVNGIEIADSGDHQIHVRSNFTNEVSYTDANAPGQTLDPGEDVTYFFEPDTKSIVRYDPHPCQSSNPTCSDPTTSVVVNKISNVEFQYYDYFLSGSVITGPHNVPSAATGRIVITVSVELDKVEGQPDHTVSFSTEVNLRNSNYMLQQY